MNPLRPSTWNPQKYFLTEICPTQDPGKDASSHENVVNVQTFLYAGFMWLFWQYSRNRDLLAFIMSFSRAQPCLFALYKWRAEKDWLMTQHTYAMCWPCTWCQRQRLPLLWVSLFIILFLLMGPVRRLYLWSHFKNCYNVSRKAAGPLSKTCLYYNCCVMPLYYSDALCCVMPLCYSDALSCQSPVPPRKVLESEARRRALQQKTYSSVVTTAILARWATVERPLA